MLTLQMLKIHITTCLIRARRLGQGLSKAAVSTCAAKSVVLLSLIRSSAHPGVLSGETLSSPCSHQTSTGPCLYNVTHHGIPNLATSAGKCQDFTNLTQIIGSECYAHSTSTLSFQQCSSPEQHTVRHAEEKASCLTHSRCCALFTDGVWEKATVSGQQRHAFSPYGNCAYGMYDAQTAVRCLSEPKVKRMVVFGDSMWRQMHMRFVHLIRDPKLVVDYSCHRHTQYSFCGHADALSFSEHHYESEEHPEWEQHIHRTFSDDADSSLPNEELCPRPIPEVQFVWAHDADMQVSRVRAYLQKFPEAENEELIMILGAPGFWDMISSELSKEYTDFLPLIPGYCSRLFVMGTPTLYIENLEHQTNVQHRNQAL